MNTVSTILGIIFRVLAASLTIYTLLCFMRILLTWVPNFSYNPFVRFLSKICDPYLNLFRGIKWLIIGSFDFSPALALCLLGAATTLLTNFSHHGTFSLGLILGMIVTLAWSIVSSIIVFLIILLAIRLIIIMITKQQHSSNIILEQIDRSITPLLYRISRTFSGNKNVSYKTALIISLIMFILIQIFGTILINYIAALFEMIPF